MLLAEHMRDKVCQNLKIHLELICYKKIASDTFLKKEFHEFFRKNVCTIWKSHLVGLSGPTRIHVQIPEVLGSLDLKNHNYLIHNDPRVNKTSF